MIRFAILLFACVRVLASPLDEFVAAAKEKHGALGEKAARYLVDHMPPADQTSLSASFLLENLDLALQARERFPWAGDVPEEIFLNDVLPYAIFDEPRDPWRADFFLRASALVNEAKTASEAAQILNRDFFKLIKTHYHTGRKRTNQSPKESMALGKATCTGLSIILVAACRSVGIPARAVGTPMWHDNSGNHTWVEIWDGGWHFTGADEYSPKGLNHGWFTGNASRARKAVPRHAIYATSWKHDDGFFPLVWAPSKRSVGAVNVTDRYARNAGPLPTTLGIRFFQGDQRVVMAGQLTDEQGKVLDSFVTKAGTADMNDMPRVAVKPGQSYRLRFVLDGVPHQTRPIPMHASSRSIHDIRPADLTPVPSGSDPAPPQAAEPAR